LAWGFPKICGEGGPIKLWCFKPFFKWGDGPIKQMGKGGRELFRTIRGVNGAPGGKMV